MLNSMFVAFVGGKESMIQSKWWKDQNKGLEDANVLWKEYESLLNAGLSHY